MELWAVIYYIESGKWQLVTIYNDQTLAAQQVHQLKQFDLNYDYIRWQ